MPPKPKKISDYSPTIDSCDYPPRSTPSSSVFKFFSPLRSEEHPQITRRNSVGRKRSTPAIKIPKSEKKEVESYYPDFPFGITFSPPKHSLQPELSLHKWNLGQEEEEKAQKSSDEERSVKSEHDEEELIFQLDEDLDSAPTPPFRHTDSTITTDEMMQSPSPGSPMG